MMATDPNAVAPAMSERRLSSMVMNPRLERNFGAFVLDAPSFVVPAGQSAGLGRLDRDANAQAHAQALFERAAESLTFWARERRRGVDPHEDVVEAVDPPEDDLELIAAG